MNTPTPTPPSANVAAFRQTITINEAPRDLISVVAFPPTGVQIALHAETSVTFYIRSAAAARELGAALIGAAAALEKGL